MMKESENEEVPCEIAFLRNDSDIYPDTSATSMPKKDLNNDIINIHVNAGGTNFLYTKKAYKQNKRTNKQQGLDLSSRIVLKANFVRTKKILEESTCILVWNVFPSDNQITAHSFT